METVVTVAIIAAAILLLLLLIKILSTPLRLMFKLLLNAAGGVVLLFVFNFLGGFVGLSLGMNWLNALIAGTLGIPGVILLLLVKFLF